MDSTWRRAKQVFHEALEKSRSERSGFVATVCGEDQQLRAQVQALLDAHDDAGEFLASPTAPEVDEATRAASTLSASLPTERPGAMIGPYKLLQVIGEGGFGVVYMAEQEVPVRRRVALKIIKLGMDTKQVIARFEAERQALALMEHPNIARVFDAGATETGRPYFVMELVKGIPITEYCDSNKLMTRERLDLFTAVCGAVQHAHQKGVIHRDIKPSNVLVTLHDGKPVPKVIDFGIAKATSQRLTEKTLFTAYGQFIGTPAYMSPEQAEMSGLDVDTRSDIYSLGVLLYELLTGTTPLDVEALWRAGYAEVQRMIREEEPSKPSAKLSTLGAASTESAKRRGTDLPTLRRQLRGDLDWITMKALQKERTRRYASALQFREDVQRFLADEPVIASPPSQLYRMRKALKRNAKLVAVLAITSVLLTTTILVGVISARTRREARYARFRLEEAQVTSALDAQRTRETVESLPPKVNKVVPDTSDPMEVQPAIDRMARRFLAGRGTTVDFQRFARALIDVSVEGAGLQTVDEASVFVRIDIDGRPLSADAGRGLGIELRPRFNLDGARISVTRDKFVVPIGEYDAYSFGLTIDLSVHASGLYVLTGPVEVQFGRMSDETSLGSMDTYLSAPLILPVPDFSVTVVDDLPKAYPVALRDEQLAADFEGTFQITPIFVSGTGGEQRTGRFTLRLAPPKIHIPLKLTIRGDDPVEWWREVRLLLSPRRRPFFLGGNMGWDVSESGKGGWDLEISVGMPGSPNLEEDIDLTVESSGAIAKSEGLDYYLDVQFSRTLTVKPDSP